MNDAKKRWFEASADLPRRGEAFVVATILATTGSTPRNPGAKIVVSADGVHDTLGGGQLEHLVIDEARHLLDEALDAQAIRQFPLAAAALQCCGGSVTVLYESFAPAFAVTVFGAGYVGREVVRLLRDLDVRVTWLDNRALADEVGATRCDAPVAWVMEEADVGHALVLTHDHQLDFELVGALLRRSARSIGLIGSTTKWRRFSDRLNRDGFAAEDIARVRCPVGTPLARKEPLAVALSIVTELLSLEERPPRTDRLTWRQIKTALVQTPVVDP